MAAAGGEVSRVEAWFEALYARLGPRYYTALAVATGVEIVLLSVPLQNLVQLPLWTGGFDRWWYVLVIDVFAVIGGLILIPLVVLGRHKEIQQFLRGQDVAPEAVWRSSVTKLSMTALICTFWFFVLILPKMPLIGYRESFTAQTYVLAITADLLITFGGMFFFLLIYEVALVPVTRRAAVSLPADFAEHGWLTLRRRLILASTGITLTTGVEVAGLTVGFDGRDAKIWAVILATVAMVFTYVGLMTLLATYSVTRHVHPIVDALSRVGQAGETVRILPSSGDDFDELGRSVNRMVARLDQHEANLRESRSRLVAMADDTRRQMERDLHDGAQQNLALVSMKLAALEHRGPHGAEMAAALADMRRTMARAIADLRSLARGIYPAALETEGIALTLEAVGRQNDVDVDVTTHGLTDWGRGIETALYFCCWEVLQRAKRDRGSDARLTVRISESDGVVDFWIWDHGHSPVDGDVLQFVEDRWRAVGGSIEPDPETRGSLVGSLRLAGAAT